MTLWIVQFKRSRRGLAEARIFQTWPSAIRYLNKLNYSVYYMKPILFRADTWSK